MCGSLVRNCCFFFDCASNLVMLLKYMSVAEYVWQSLVEIEH